MKAPQRSPRRLIGVCARFAAKVNDLEILQTHAFLIAMRLLNILILNSLLSFHILAESRLVTLVNDETLTISSNEVAEIIACTGSSVTHVYMINTNGGVASVTYPANGGLAANPIVLSGPRTIRAERVTSSSSAGMLTARVTDSVSYQAAKSGFAPTSTLVIPTEPAGNTQVILESSSDLVNWTAAQPGVYGNGTSNRFFRIRAQKTN